MNPSAMRLWLSDVMSLQRVSRCSRARAQHPPYRGWAARLRTRRSSTRPRSESGSSPEESPGPGASPRPSSSNRTCGAAISTCLQVSQSQSSVFTGSEVTSLSSKTKKISHRQISLTVGVCALFSGPSS